MRESRDSKSQSPGLNRPLRPTLNPSIQEDTGTESDWDPEDIVEVDRIEIQALISEGNLEDALGKIDKLLNEQFTLEDFKTRVEICRLLHQPQRIVQELRVLQQVALCVEHLSKTEFKDLKTWIRQKEAYYKKQLQTIDSQLRTEAVLPLPDRFFIWRLLIESLALKSETKESSGEEMLPPTQPLTQMLSLSPEDKQALDSLTKGDPLGPEKREGIYQKEFHFLKNLCQDLKESIFIRVNARDVINRNHNIELASKENLQKVAPQWQLRLKGERANLEGQTRQAIEHLSQAIKEEEDPDLLLSRGRLYAGVGYYQNAYDDFKKVKNKSPNRPEGWVGCAQVCLLARQLNDCRDELNKTPEKFHQNASWMNTKAELYRLHGFHRKTDEVTTTASDLLEQVIQAETTGHRSLFSPPANNGPTKREGEGLEKQSTISKEIDGEASHLAMAYFLRSLVNRDLSDLDPEQFEKVWDDLMNASQYATNPALTWLIRAENHRVRDEHHLALLCYHNASKENPHDFFAQSRIALIWNNKGIPQRALETITELVKSFPNDLVAPEALTLKGRLHLLYGQWKEAEKTFSQAYAINPNSPAILVGVATAYLELSEYEEAKLYLDLNKAFRASSNVPLTLRLQKRLDFLQAHTDSRVSSRQKDDQSLANEIKFFLMKRQFTEALECLEDVLTNDPTNSIALKWKGEIYRLHGQYDMAKQAFEEAQNHLPEEDSEEKVFIFSRLGEIFWELQQTQKANEAIAFALKQANSPSETQTHSSSERQRRPLSPGMLKYIPQLPSVDYGALSPREEPSTQPLIKKPDHLFALSMKAVILASEGQFEEALTLLQDHHDDPLVLTRLGSIYHQQQLVYLGQAGYEEEARKNGNLAQMTIVQALELDSTSPLTWTILGDIYFARGWYKEAVNAYQTAQTFDPDYAPVVPKLTDAKRSLLDVYR